MRIGRREFIKLGGASAAYALAGGAAAAPTGRAIIDVHMHAYPATMQLTAPVIGLVTGVESCIVAG